jgi:DNA-binding CsgD family transcriptional regulator
MAEYGEPLSKREIEVLELVVTGATNRQIAQELVVSVNTVKVHLRNIFAKLGVESRTEATLKAIQDGLVDVPELQTDPDTNPPPATEQAPRRSSEPLPWPKRIALVTSIVVVALITIVTWPQSNTAAEPPSDDTDNPVNGISSIDATGETTGWRTLAPMTIARSRFALAADDDGYLYAIGGETSGGKTGAVERYDPATDQWSPVAASKPTRVSNISAASIGEWIYVPGGLEAEGGPTAVVEAYQPAEGTWDQFSPLPQPLSSYALTEYDEQLYLFGGKDERGHVINATFIYNSQQDKWEIGKPMPSRRAYAAAAPLGSRIYVIGGYDGKQEQTTCEAYLVEEGNWESCEPLTLARGGLGVAAVANQLFAVGGGWSGYLWFNEKHSPGTSDWLPFETPVGQQWRNLAVVSMPDKFYVAGGWNGDYLNGVWEYVVFWHKIFIPATP